MWASSVRSHGLTVLEQFGTDPGSLLASTDIPWTFPKNGPLVVVLHGSSQSAESYNTRSGWSMLAVECNLALLFPGQKRSNKLTGGFNWFKPGDSQRDGGEALSIRQRSRRSQRITRSIPRASS